MHSRPCANIIKLGVEDEAGNNSHEEDRLYHEEVECPSWGCGAEGRPSVHGYRGTDEPRGEQPVYRSDHKHPGPGAG